MEDELAAVFVRSIQELKVKQFAFETVVLHALANATAPGRALALVKMLRGGLGIDGPPAAEQLKLLAEEHVNDIADRLEHIIRAPANPATDKGK